MIQTSIEQYINAEQYLGNDSFPVSRESVDLIGGSIQNALKDKEPMVYVSSGTPSSASAVFESIGGRVRIGERTRLVDSEETSSHTLHYIAKMISSSIPKVELPFRYPTLRVSTLNKVDIKKTRFSILDSLVNRLSISCSRDLANRVRYLYVQSLKEDDEYQKVLDVGSLQGFIDFLLENKDLKKPDVVLTPEGSLRASWKVQARKFFRLEFLPTLDIKYVVFVPNEKYPNKTDMGSGKTTSDQVLHHLSNFNIDTWAY